MWRLAKAYLFLSALIHLIRSSLAFYHTEMLNCFTLKHAFTRHPLRYIFVYS
ncbi:hypothetical protein P20311_1510 [Pseudoalteromonas sp. BSi20311]|nr:hypothetical protein P20311_1510 [Pseudoalteromonas sp. BSi20311]GAA73344.1 hypothetical protein P20439_3464 [Pseudoalteromonas sp. BSi20439]